MATLCATLLLAAGAEAASPRVLSAPLRRTHGVVSPHTRRLQKKASLHANAGGDPHSKPTNGSIWPVALYWTEVSIGTPAKVFPVAIDSGSGDLDIQGADCSGCPKSSPNNFYDPSDSSTSKRTFPYKFSNTYETCDLSDPSAPCTISGDVFTDAVSFAGLDSVDVKFGAITKQTENFDQFRVVCGVMGMTGSDQSQNSVFSRYVTQRGLDDIWAMCIAPGPDGNGTLTFGGVDERLASGDVQYTPNAGTGDGFYSMSFDAGVLVGGTPVEGLAGERAILDSGTNVLLLPQKYYDAMKTVFVGLCGSGDGANLHGICDVAADATLFEGKCFTYTQDQIDAFPPMTLSMQNVNLNMTAADYLLPQDPRAAGDGQLCLGVRPSDLLIVGDTTMRNYYVVFDRENNQIGWAPVNMDNCGKSL